MSTKAEGDFRKNFLAIRAEERARLASDPVLFSVPVSRALLDGDRECAANKVAELAHQAVLQWTADDEGRAAQ